MLGAYRRVAAGWVLLHELFYQLQQVSNLIIIDDGLFNLSHLHRLVEPLLISTFGPGRLLVLMLCGYTFPSRRLVGLHTFHFETPVYKQMPSLDAGSQP